MASAARNPRFEGRVAIVTGSTNKPSIGRACAEGLAREGASVVINGRNEQQLKEAERDFRDEGFKVISVLGSPEDDDVPPRLAEAAVNEFGRIDIVVNTVGGAKWAGPPLEMDKAGFVDTVVLNGWTSVAVIQAAMQRGLADGGGAVVNTSSGTTHLTTPPMIAYKAGKSALNALTQTLARELGPMGVRVNAVAPGLTKSTATKTMWDIERGDFVLGRFPDPEDTANVVLFLASDEAAMVTGLTIDVDGGDHLMGGWSPYSRQA